MTPTVFKRTFGLKPSALLNQIEMSARRLQKLLSQFQGQIKPKGQLDEALENLETIVALAIYGQKADVADAIRIAQILDALVLRVLSKADFILASGSQQAKK